MPPCPTVSRPFVRLRKLILPVLAALPLLGAPLHADDWGNVVQVNGTSYIPLDTLRSFYKFSPLPTGGNSNTMAVSNGGVPLVFTPGTTRITIGGYECRLAYPATRHSNGDLLVSQTDAVKLLDPLLRPTYITPRRQIQTIILDPGHGGSDAGCTANGLREADVVLKIAQKLRAILVKKGYNVVITRDQDRSVSDQRRLELVQESNAPLFISIHLNEGRSDIRGIETYCVQPGEHGKPTRPGNTCDAANAVLAFSLHSALISATGATDGAFRRARFSLLTSIPCPAAHVEAGYATNKEEAALLATDDYQGKIAQAMADGISTFASALKPGAQIPSTTAPIDVTTPPAPYQADAPAPAEQQPATHAKGKPAKGKPTPTKPKGKPQRGRR